MAFHNPGPGALIMIIFPVAHLAAGVGITYFTIAVLANRTVVTVAGNDLRIRHRPVPWRGNRNVDASTIIQLHCDQVISNSNRGSTPWSYRVNALLKDERRLRLLSGLDKDQALFYEQKLEEWLGIEPYPVSGAVE
jgi:hypothetical protein